MDGIRLQMVSRFWLQLKQNLNIILSEQVPEWQVDVIEDRNTAEALVGLQCKSAKSVELHLFPMIEQQLIGGRWRIFCGLMWQSAPTSEQLAQPCVTALKNSLTDAGFQSNASFLGWRWMNYYPHRRDFLMRFSLHCDELMNEVVSGFGTLLLDQSTLINNANSALQDMPRSMPVSLDQLRRKRVD